MRALTARLRAVHWLQPWWLLTAAWRCGCCGEIYGTRCDRYCGQDGCVHGRV